MFCWFGGKTIGHVMGQSKQIVSNINQTGQEEEEGRRRNKHRKHKRGENQRKPIVDKKKTKKDCRRKSGLNVLQDQFFGFSRKYREFKRGHRERRRRRRERKKETNKKK